MSKKSCKAPIFKPTSNFWGCLILMIIYMFVIAVLAFLAIFSEKARCLIKQYLFRITHCGTGNSADYIDLDLFNSSSLRIWLNNNSVFKEYIVWEKPDNDGLRTVYKFRDWTLGEQYQLYEMYELIKNGGQTNLQEAPPHTIDISSTSNRVYATNIDPDLAWKYFLAFIALSLVNDLENRLNWSITDTTEYTEIQIRYIFDSRYYYFYNETTNEYQFIYIRNDPQPDIESSRNNGYATIGDPVRIYNYLFTNGIIGATQEETIGRMMGWCRENMRHYTYASTPDNLIKHWQYDGFPPVERVLNGTIHQDRPTEGIQHFTAGCWGTTGFLKIVMRTVNIPVQFLSVFAHAMPGFPREELYLSHGDDPYNAFSSTVTPPYPPLEILIDIITYNAWFDYDLTDIDDRMRVNNNLGRRTKEIAVQYLPIYLIDLYCQDIANGSSHAVGKVYETLSGPDNQYYTLDDLETTYDLWTRMDAFINSIGGCGNLTYP